MYIGEFKNEEDIRTEFQIDKIEGAVLFAVYEIDGYEGDAFVLFVRDGVIYTVEGGHCSCYGLEGQWRPDEAPPQVLLHRMTKGCGLLVDYRREITEALIEAASRGMLSYTFRL